MKKRLFGALLACAFLFGAAGCSPAAEIGIITNVPGQSRAAEAAEALAAENSNVLPPVCWPETFASEPEAVAETVKSLTEDRKPGALVLHEAVPGTAAALRAAKKSGLFVAAARSVFVSGDSVSELAEEVDLLLSVDQEVMGRLLAQQAADMGATTLVYYTLPRSSFDPGKLAHRTAAENACAELGLTFVPLGMPDDSYDAGTPGMEIFFGASAAAKVLDYGTDVAFYADNCSMQVPLLREVLRLGAIFPQPCCPSLRHGLTEVLALDESMDDEALVAAITEALAQRGLSGRIAGYRMDQEELELRLLTAATEKQLAGETVEPMLLAELIDSIAEYECELSCYDDGETLYANVICYAVMPEVF